MKDQQDGAQEPMTGAGKTEKSGYQQKGALAEVKANAAKEEKREDASDGPVEEGAEGADAGE